MSPKHDPENIPTDDDLKHETWFKEWEEYMEWKQQMDRLNDEERA